MNLNPLKRNILPDAPTSLLKMIGPSFIFVGLSLGSGELILWPYLVSNYGLGIMWGALLGISMQFFLNMEIERYALVNGESIFVGFARIFKNVPYWFVFSTAIAWAWPGFAAASAEILGFFGVPHTTYVAVAMLVLVGIFLTLGPSLYKTVERIEKTLILIGVPSIILIAILTVYAFDLWPLLQGMIGVGEGYKFFPTDKTFPFSTFLAALAYSGAGGNLLLAQSFYIKEKGYGMGKYAGKISSLITGKNENIELEGSTFEPNETELKKFKGWWKSSNLEHLLIFWGLGLFTMLLLALISYANVYNISGSKTEGIKFLFNQANVINTHTTLFGIAPITFLGSFLLIITAMMLFSTQLTVIDAAGRIIAENLALIFKDKISGRQIPKLYYLSIWVILLFGIGVLLIGINQPQSLIVIGAIINAFCMFIFSGMLIKTNKTLLHKAVWPSKTRQFIVYAIFVIMGAFSVYVIYDQYNAYTNKNSTTGQAPIKNDFKKIGKIELHNAKTITTIKASNGDHIISRDFSDAYVQTVDKLVENAKYELALNSVSNQDFIYTVDRIKLKLMKLDKHTRAFTEIPIDGIYITAEQIFKLTQFNDKWASVQVGSSLHFLDMATGTLHVTNKFENCDITLCEAPTLLKELSTNDFIFSQQTSPQAVQPCSNVNLISRYNPETDTKLVLHEPAQMCNNEFSEYLGIYTNKLVSSTTNFKLPDYPYSAVYETDITSGQKKVLISASAMPKNIGYIKLNKEAHLIYMQTTDKKASYTFDLYKNKVEKLGKPIIEPSIPDTQPSWGYTEADILKYNNFEKANKDFYTISISHDKIEPVKLLYLSPTENDGRSINAIDKDGDRVFIITTDDWDQLVGYDAKHGPGMYLFLNDPKPKMISDHEVEFYVTLHTITNNEKPPYNITNKQKGVLNLDTGDVFEQVVLDNTGRQTK